MKHPYSIPNHSKEDTLYKARETLKKAIIISPMYGTISVYDYMRSQHAKHVLVANSWVSNGEYRSVFMIKGWEVTEDVYEAAITLLKEWGYEYTLEVISWCVRYVWENRGLRKR